MAKSKHRDDQLFAAPCTFNRDVTCKADHTVAGNQTVTGNLVVTGTQTFTGDQAVTGTLTVGGLLQESGGALVATPAEAVLTFDRVRHVRHARITLTALVIAVANADDFGGEKILDLPDSNIMILGTEVDLVVTKGLTASGIVGTTDIVMGVGTAVGSAQPLTGAMIDVLTAAFTADEDVVDYEQHTHDLSSPALVFADDSATGALFLNIAAVITADDDVTVSGTIDIYYVDLGNVTS